MTANTAAERTARDSTRRAVQRTLPSARSRPRRSSHHEPAATRIASTPQNTPSTARSGNEPRIQNHWYECRSHVAANTISVDATTVNAGDRPRIRSDTGQNTTRVMKSFQ